MQLTSKQIISSGIISHYCDAGVQQQGIDCRIKNIAHCIFGGGIIPAKGKTILPDYTYVTPQHVRRDSVDVVGWSLGPGWYEIEFEEGCKIPNNMVLDFKTRSSLVRCGAVVYSGQFDAGFKTDNMGAFLHVVADNIFIEYDARVAQAVVHETAPVDEEYMYDGQWQGDKQRQDTNKRD